MNKENQTQLSLEFRDALAFALNNAPGVVNRNFVSITATPPPDRLQHMYERDDWGLEGHWTLRYNGALMAYIRRYPHKMITLRPQKHLEFQQKLLGRVLDMYYPDTIVKIGRPIQGQANPYGQGIVTHTAGSGVSLDEATLGQYVNITFTP